MFRTALLVGAVAIGIGVVAAPVASAEVYYKNCTEARAAGAALIYQGQPGYRAGLDRDGDGIACE
jgi:hypothetical protein